MSNSEQTREDNGPTPPGSIEEMEPECEVGEGLEQKSPSYSEKEESDPGQVEDSGEEYVPKGTKFGTSSFPERGRSRVRRVFDTPDTPVVRRVRDKSVHRGHYFSVGDTPSTTATDTIYRTRDPAKRALAFHDDLFSEREKQSVSEHDQNHSLSEDEDNKSVSTDNESKSESEESDSADGLPAF